jgi:hypothetical protein
MRRFLIFPIAAALTFAQTQNVRKQPVAAKPNDSGVKPRVIVVPKSPEEEQFDKLALINAVLGRYQQTRAWLDGLKAKYPNEVGEDEAHIVGRHYAAVEDGYRKSAVPIGEGLIDDFADYHLNTSFTSTLSLQTMVVDAQHLDLILDGLHAEDRKWLRNQAKHRVEPGIVVVVGK